MSFDDLLSISDRPALHLVAFFPLFFALLSLVPSPPPSYVVLILRVLVSNMLHIIHFYDYPDGCAVVPGSVVPLGIVRHVK